MESKWLRYTYIDSTETVLSPTTLVINSLIRCSKLFGIYVVGDSTVSVKI